MKAVMKKFTPADYLTNQWSGGTTTQVAIGPEGATYAARDFAWRVSTAMVSDSESDFTNLPAYTRYISTLEGSMDLTADGVFAKTVTPGVMYRFDGGQHTHSVGTCRDFNLMFAKEGCSGLMTSLSVKGSASINTEYETVVLYVKKGALKAAFGGETAEAKTGETLQITGDCGELLTLDAPEGCSLMIAQVSCRK